MQNTVADGVPLEVIGHVNIPVSLGQFRVEQEYTVVKILSVECILGADFLVHHGAIIDCKANTLHWVRTPDSKCQFIIQLLRAIPLTKYR